MRFLHTSDWHLGRLFHRASLLDEQAAAMDRIVQITREEGVHAVLIAGDLYDRSVPPAEAVELFDRTLSELHRAGVAIVAISGNHDSAIRVGFGDRLLSNAGVTLRGDLARAGEAVELPAEDGGPPVRVHPVPYLDPLVTAHLARSAEEGPDPCEARRRFTHHDAMAWAMARVRSDLARTGAARSVALAHTFVTGAEPSASERELSLGHVDQVSMSVFDGIDYVALGHLHRRQAFDNGRVVYSGTPLRYSFSEQRNTPSVELIDMSPDGSCSTRRVELKVGRDMCTVTGELDHLLSDRSLDHAEDSWVRVVLTDRNLPLQAMRRLQQRFAHAVELSHEPLGPTGDPAVGARSARSADVDPLELAAAFLNERRGLDLDDDERSVLAESFAEVLTGARP
ncbi:MAG: exonuclease SbcCD subunit D [Microthrixaceae bacterium]